MAGQPLNEVNNSFFLIILLVVTQEKRSRKQKLPVTPSILLLCVRLIEMLCVGSFISPCRID